MHGGVRIMYRGARGVLNKVFAIKALFRLPSRSPELPEVSSNEPTSQRSQTHRSICIRELLFDHGRLYIEKELIEGNSYERQPFWECG